MNAFQYKGYDASGNAVTGEILAASVDEVERKMMNQQVTLVLVKPTKMGKDGVPKTAATAQRKSSGGRKATDQEAATILSNLATMVNAGVPFVDGLDAIAAVTNKQTIRDGIADMKAMIIEGHSLAAALRSAKALFPELVADMVRVAEEGSSLGTALASAAAYLSRKAELRRKVMNAMLYPMVMLGVSFLTVLVLVIFVMPKFADVFIKMHADIPITTRLLLDFGDLLRAKPWVCLGCFVGGIIGLRFAFKNEQVAKVGGVLVLKMPGIGDLMKKLALSRALQSISALISGNVPIVQALEHGAKVAGNRALSAAITRSVTFVEQGGTLSDAFAEAKAFPPILTQMIGVGERTGKLAPMLATCAEQMEEETDSRLKSLVGILEPVMIVVMGILVGTITVSIITPIYSAVQHVK